MNKLVTIVAALCASVAFGVAAQEQVLKIGMVISTGEKVLATPTLVIASGKRGSVRIGEKVVVPASTQISNNVIEAELAPTLQADGSVNLPVTLMVSEQSMVDGQPSKASRKMDIVLKLYPGVKSTVVLGEADSKEPLKFSIQVDLLND